MLRASWTNGIGCLFANRYPTVKGKTPVAAEDDEEEELRKLQAEMAM